MRMMELKCLGGLQKARGRGRRRFLQTNDCILPYKVYISDYQCVFLRYVVNGRVWEDCGRHLMGREEGGCLQADTKCSVPPACCAPPPSGFQSEKKLTYKQF